MTETQSLFNALELSGDLLLDEPLSKHCTFRIGGNAELIFIPRSEKALIEAIKTAVANGIPYRILGNGSNVLISDDGLQGLTVKIAGGLTDIIYLGDGVIGCGAGVQLVKLCIYARDRELSGLEFAYGIPGSVGGALYMNAGAYGGEIKNVLMSVRYYDPATDTVGEIKAEEMDYAYRHTPFMSNGRIITAGYFHLQQGNKEEINAKMDELIGKRKDKQPIEMPSAGSTFKRPEGYFAAALIDECGLRGYSVGGAQVSEKHAGFVVNKGGATCQDVLDLMEYIKQTVLREKGVELSPEVEFLGNN